MKTMTTEDVITFLQHMLQERFDLPAEIVTPETRREAFGLDSLLMVDLLLDIETELDFAFSSYDIPANPSIRELASFIADQRNAANARAPIN